MAEYKKYHLHSVVDFLTKRVNDAQLQNIWIVADIVDNKNEIHGKHYYFALKEEGANQENYYLKACYFNCPMGKKELLLAGGHFEFFGSVSLYNSYINFIVRDFKKIESIETKIQAVKKRLEELGLVGTNKLVFPRFPKQIALVTAAGHAAINDLITSLEKRYPLVRYKLYPCLVQGENAPQSICEAIKKASMDSDNEVLIIGRGGGSMEDLMAFNDFDVCLAIAKLKIPSISAVGHSTDQSLTDLVATAKAITPTSAAEYAVPDGAILLKNAQTYNNQIKDYLKNKFIKLREQVAYYENLILKNSPTNIINNHYKQLDNFKLRLYQGYNRIINKYSLIYNNIPQKITNYFKAYLLSYYDLIKDISFQIKTGIIGLVNSNYNNINHYTNVFNTNMIKLFNTKFNLIETSKINLYNNIKTIYQNKTNLLLNIENNISSNNPKRIFKMGYAKLKTLTNLDINSIDNLKLNDNFYTYLEDGMIKSQVLEIKKYKGE